MNNQTYTNETDAQMQEFNSQAVAAIISFVVLALTIGVVIALLVASQQRKPKTFREKLEYNLGKSSEATAQAFKQLSKDINELRKSIEDRIESRR